MASERGKFKRSLPPTSDSNRGSPAGAEFGRVRTRSIEELEEMLLRATPVIGQEHPQLRAIVREGVNALCKAWAAHSLRRALADVASTSEQDYRHFGLDKAEIVAALSRLHDEISGSGPVVAERLGPGGIGCPLAILVTKRQCL
jgi:hypothetical protein